MQILNPKYYVYSGTLAVTLTAMNPMEACTIAFMRFYLGNNKGHKLKKIMKVSEKGFESDSVVFQVLTKVVAGGVDEALGE